ncbi:MAG TPA: PVC-type heme-binding CxxCH protein [Gemmataceae bacterium]|nr:PVC-type heme-binding CxxCH protein [Gemmataceae bacterium]
MLKKIIFLFLAVVTGAQSPARADNPSIKVLFLGDNGHHQPALRFRQLQPVLAAHGIDLTYTDRVEALNAKTLGAYDGLLIYANTTALNSDQERALLDYVAGGKGFIPLHCASYCFLNSPKYIDLVGAQFLRHSTGVFRTTIAEPDHPIMKGFRGFESWDETYVHTKHNEKDRTVLEYRIENGVKEPWTWVRTQGKGRVFYTAWGHDERTWGNPGFQNLLERGIRWAVGSNPAVVPAFADEPEMTPLAKDVKPFAYVEAKVPFYPPSERWGVTSDPIRTMQVPLEPAESMKHFVHPADFELKLFAAEPDLGGKPICMNWDERGRLWVGVTVDYPNNKQREGQGHDRIVICEDTDGDGRADKFTVFADKLSLPTSLTFANGGVIVHQPPQTLFLKDTDGDGVADERKVLFTGWSTSDTHAGPSNLRWGLDNWIYGIVGYAGYNGTVGGTHLSFSQGFYRFKPDGSELEFLRNTNNNSWGVGFSEEGLLFGSTANGNPSVYLPIPNRYYESVRGWSSTVLPGIAGDPKFHPITDKVRQVDYHGRFTAAAGHALYTARSYPPEYWNKTAFVAEPTGHLVATFAIQGYGSNFRSRPAWNLLASNDEWSAPIMAEVGPDGQVWVIDWYNYIVQHNPTPPGFRTGKGGAYETDLRDKKHGRIYRLVSKSTKPAAPLSLQGASTEKLIDTLKNDNMFWRLHAQRLLVERGQLDVLPALIRLTGDTSVDAIGLNPAVIHALWTLQGLGALDGTHPEASAAALAALHHKSAGVRRNAIAVLPRNSLAPHPSSLIPSVRRNAVAVLPRNAESLQALLGSGVLDDPDAQVRLAALLALSEMPADAQAGAAVARVSHNPDNIDDRWLADAATIAGAAHDVYFLKAIAADKMPCPPKLLQALAIVAEHYARGGPAASAGPLLVALPDADAKLTAAVLAGLAKGWPKNHPAQLGEDTELALQKLLPRLSPGAKGQLIKLATAWGSKSFGKYADEIVGSLLAAAADEKQSDDQRVLAARQLVEFRPSDTGVVSRLLALVSPRTSPQLAAGIIDALGSSESSSVGPAIVERFGSWTPAARAAGLRVLFGRADSTRALLDAVDKVQISLMDLALDQRQALASHPDRRIAERARKLLERGGGLVSPDRQKVVEQFLSLTRRIGNAALGKLVFKNQCSKCHTHSGEGNKVGPDLTGMAVHPKEHLLIDILDPNRSVEGNFRVYVLETKDGRFVNGLLASETRTSVELLDAEAKKQVVLRENIAELTATPKSLMPEGFEKQLSQDDLANLLEFLTQRGKFLPLPLAKAATVVSTRGMFFSEDSRTERLVFEDWSPKVFDGIPFNLVDPQGGRVRNVILLYGPQGEIPPKMPRSVRLPCNAPAKAVHLLSGVSGWGYPLGEKGSVSLVVRLHYEDGKTEDHSLKNGEQFADYIRRVDVPGSKFAFRLRGQQIRYLAIYPQREQTIKEIELRKGPDDTAPVVMAVTIETR